MTRAAESVGFQCLFWFFSLVHQPSFIQLVQPTLIKPGLEIPKFVKLKSFGSGVR
jgi:hypothetical protein